MKWLQWPYKSFKNKFHCECTFLLDFKFFHGKKVNKLGKKVEAFKFLGDYGAINGFGAI